MVLQSWDFLFFANLALALIYFWIPFTFKWNIFIAILPWLLAVAEFVFKFKGDAAFHFCLIALHWNLSHLNLFLLKWGEKHLRPLAIFLWMMVQSAGILAFHFSFPSLVFVDPYLGVLPGMVFADAAISLHPYWLRLGASSSAWLFIFFFKWKARSFGWIFLGLLFTASQIIPGPFTLRPVLEKQFLHHQKSDKIHVYSSVETIHNSELSIVTPELLKTAIDQFKNKIPEVKVVDSAYRIFIYDRARDKAKWIGARDVQIGNFLRGEMHLNLDALEKTLVTHELAHLFHGHLNVSLKSFADPFWFEGFAVALSESEAELREKTAALLKADPSIKDWPRGLKFNTHYLPISYTLAGLHASLALKEKKWPWDFPIPSIENFKDYPVSKKVEAWAQRVVSRPSLSADPLRRDCSRLSIEIFEDKKYEKFKKYSNLCHHRSDFVFAPIK